ncbi:MFS transporter [Kitasatospora saccharophila]|uniref:MFS transporter n=1 Tax=Kitasatospora saccharophila TaxID=407973 RepID=A0ABN2X9Q7_9ACTN
MSLLRDVRALPALTKRLLLLAMINNLGTGLIMPFMVVYVHNVRGLDVTVATSAVAVSSVGVVLGAPLAGWLTDRRSPETAAVLHLSVQTAGIAAYAFADRGWEFIAAALVVGLGAGGGAAWGAMYSASAPAEVLPVVFTTNLTGANAASGLGALIGAALASVSHPATFRGLYLADAASCALVALGIAVGVRTGARSEDRDKRHSTDGASYAVVLRHPLFLAVLVLGGLLFLASYAQLESGLPVYLTTRGVVTSSGLGVLFAVNTVCVITSQLLLHRVLKRIRHTRAVTVAAVLWTGTWLLVPLASLAGRGLAALAVLVVAMGLFAVAETFYAAGMPVLVNALAPENARGRYNAAYSSVVSLGFVAGPFEAGAYAGGPSGTIFIEVLAIACAVVALAFGLSRHWFRNDAWCTDPDKATSVVTDESADRAAVS